MGVTRKQDINFSKVQKEYTEQLFFKSLVTSARAGVIGVYPSHAAARSTMVDISCRALSVRVVMASLSHNLMSVTTW